MAQWYENFTKNYWQNHRNDSSYDWYNTLNYAMNMESAQKQMNFQDYMSSTSHQREVDDLLKAGLNPVLSANNGAATGAGAYASVDNSMAMARKQAQLQEALQKRDQLNQRFMQDKTLAQDKKLTTRMQDLNVMVAREQMANQFYMNKYSTDMGYQLGINQASINAGAITSAAAMNSAATRYASEQSRMASQYASDNALAASKYGSEMSYNASVYGQDAETARKQYELDWNTRYPKSIGGLAGSWIKAFDDWTGYSPVSGAR